MAATVEVRNRDCKRRFNRPGFSLVELLVVVALIALLIALLIPAVNAARAAARRTHCLNNLRQLALGTIEHESALRALPSGGWGFGWVGDPDRTKREQPGGWTFSVLPYIEETSLYAMGQGLEPVEKRAAVSKMNTMPVAAFNCPTRRPPAGYPYQSPPQMNANIVVGELVAKTDYAANGGETNPAGGFGPRSLDAADDHKWTDRNEFTGVIFQRSDIRMGEVIDGTTKTYLVGEKHLSPRYYANGKSPGDDQSMYAGEDSDTLRFTQIGLEPAQDDDSTEGEMYRFGSAHSSGVHLAFCDGSARRIEYDVDSDIHRASGNRRDSK